MIPLGVLASGYVAPAGGGGWEPTDLTGLTAWFDASDTSTITHNAGAVSLWSDKSGNGNTVSQGSSAAQPTTGTRTIGALNALDFSSGDYIYRNSVPHTQPLTLAMIAQTDNATPSANAFVTYLTPASVGIRGYGINDWTINAGGHVLAGTDADTSPHLLVAVFNGASSEIRLDGTSLATGNAGTTANAAIAIGGSNVGALWDGLVGEWIDCAGALSGTDLASLESYLMTKWGIS